VANAYATGQGLIGQQLFQIAEFAFGSAAINLTVSQGGDPGGIITAVFQAF
jgi:hypothetical protein